MSKKTLSSIENVEEQLLRKHFRVEALLLSLFGSNLSAVKLFHLKMLLLVTEGRSSLSDSEKSVICVIAWCTNIES